MGQIKNVLYNKDVQWVIFFNNRLKCKLLDVVLPKITYIGSAAISISICFLIIGMGGIKERHIGIEALVSLAVSHIIVEILKRIICRERPKNVLEKINIYNVPIDLYSFPSGHSTAVFSIAAVLSIYSHPLAFLCVPIALIVSVSRIYLGVHYPSDVAAGIIIAVLSATVLHYMFF
jgi:undecaprenyl-diphosphatase